MSKELAAYQRIAKEHYTLGAQAIASGPSAATMAPKVPPKMPQMPSSIPAKPPIPAKVTAPAALSQDSEGPPPIIASEDTPVSGGHGVGVPPIIASEDTPVSGGHGVGVPPPDDEQADEL
jgi:hypothetical protein